MQSTADLSALVKNAQGGDEKAFSELYQLTVNSSYRTAYLYLSAHADIEDALQNAYAKVAKNLNELKEPEKFCSWVSSIVKNECINYIKKESKKPVPTLFVKSIPENNGGTKDTFSEEFIERDELRQKVNGVLDGLNPEIRSCLILYYYEEYSIKDIASLLGVPEGTVKSRLHYGKKQFEKEFRKLQKKDPTLYGISAIPFLVSFIAFKASSAVVPETVAKTAVTLASSAGASAGAVSAGATGGVSASAGVVGGVAAASSGAASTAGAAIAGTSVAVKVAAVAVAGAIAVGGSTVAVKNAVDNRNTSTTAYSTEMTEEVTTAMIAVIPSETAVTAISLTSAVNSTSSSVKTTTKPQFPSQTTEHKTTKTESAKASTTRITTTKKHTTTVKATTTKPTTTAPTTTKPATTIPATTLPSTTKKETTTLAETTKKETTTLAETTSVQSNYAASGGVLTEYTGGESSVSIPSSVDGNNITSIGAGAFLGNSDITSISIPSGVTQIGQEAFADCTSLTSVSIPATVKKIGMGAFYGCSSLSSVTLPGGVTEISDEAFAECVNLSSITIPNSVTNIATDAFSGCDSLTICCEENSVAHNYAIENSIEYVLI